MKVLNLFSHTNFNRLNTQSDEDDDDDDDEEEIDKYAEPVEAGQG